MAILRLPDADLVGVLTGTRPQAPPEPFAQALTYTEPVATAAPAAGQAVTLDSAGFVPTETIRIATISADPTELLDGQMWIRLDLNEFRWREGGVTYKVAGTAV